MPRESERDDLSYVWDMLRFSYAVRRLVTGRDFEEFKRNEEFRLAVERAVEIIGESARHVSKEFEQTHGEIPWRPIRAQRHILAHDYGDVIPAKLWDVATVKIPLLIPQLTKLLPPDMLPLDE